MTELAYQETLAALQAELYPATAFPLDIWAGGRSYRFDVWRGQQLSDLLLAIDCETMPIRDREIPVMAIAAIYGHQSGGWFLHPADLPAFIRQHPRAAYVAHNATFDFWVIHQALNNHPAERALWWQTAAESRLCCTMLLESLIQLAHIDAEPVNRPLDVLADRYCGIGLDKSDPYRLRYGELIGLSVDDWTDTELGIWTYAGLDPVATLLIAEKQIAEANRLIAPHQATLLPDAIGRFGPLTGCLQVQGAIALDFISKSGVHVDRGRVETLRYAIDTKVKEAMQQLQDLGGVDLFKRYKRTGKLKYAKSGAPQRNAKQIKSKLEAIAKTADTPIRPPRNKDKLVTDAVRYWEQHIHIDPFIETYVRFNQQAKLLQFFEKLDTDWIYPTYDPLKRTGRTSCRNPNLQQLPRDSRFRETIQAPPGCWLLQIDFSVLELRTLAQVCLRRYGKSVLADLFRVGVDPHRHTAAVFTGRSVDQFNQLYEADQKEFRQRAKVFNFGVPGGLGAESIVSFAKTSYGLDLTMDEAKQFRKKLCQDIYPEIGAYLNDRSTATLAVNLQCRELQTRQASRTRFGINEAFRIVSGCEESADGKEYPVDMVDRCWLCLAQLNQNSDLAELINNREPSVELARKIFLGPSVTLSGRIRGHVGFTQACNTPFQGLAADGNKLAMFRLLHRGYQLCGFVHDEMLILVPDGIEYTTAVLDIQRIMHEAMAEFTPDIPIASEYLLADRWYKDAPQQPVDDRGRIVPYSKIVPIKFKKRAGPYDPESIWSFCQP